MICVEGDGLRVLITGVRHCVEDDRRVLIIYVRHCVEDGRRVLITGVWDIVEDGRGVLITGVLYCVEDKRRVLITGVWNCWGRTARVDNKCVILCWGRTASVVSATMAVSPDRPPTRSVDTNSREASTPNKSQLSSKATAFFHRRHHRQRDKGAERHARRVKAAMRVSAVFMTWRWGWAPSQFL